MKKLLIPLLPVLLSVCACVTHQEMDPAMYESDTVSLMVKGSLVYTLPQEEGQLEFFPARGEFVAGNDDMSEYFVLRCSPLPAAEGQTLTGSLRWMVREKGQSLDNLVFEVKKMDDTGLVWLWSAKNKTGAVVKILASS